MILGTWFGAWGAWQYGPWWGVAIGIARRHGRRAPARHGHGHLRRRPHHLRRGHHHAGRRHRPLPLGRGLRRRAGRRRHPVPPGRGRGHASTCRSWRAATSSAGSPRTSSAGSRTRAGCSCPTWPGCCRGFTHNLSYLTLIALLLVPVHVVAAVAHRLRPAPALLRREPDRRPTPSASPSTGCGTSRCSISGALAGLAGAFLAIEAAGIYRQGQTGGRGFIGLAAMIFGNWMPFGAAAGAGLFGFADALQLRGNGRPCTPSCSSWPLAAGLLRRGSCSSRAGAAGRRSSRCSACSSGSGTSPPTRCQPEFVQATPYVITLLVLSFASQRLRPPAAEGKPWRKGQVE